jgi:lambda repressor-like predicted transcriptional regulator
MQLSPLDESLNEGSSQSTIAIALRYVYMKMRRIISADIFDRAEVGNVIEVVERYWIF